MSTTPPIAIPRGSESRRTTPAATTNNDREQTMSQQPPFRLQTRRGSRSAPDPWALGPLTSSSTTANGPDNSPTTAATGGATGSTGHPTPASSLGATTTNIPSTSASRITIVRVHDDFNSRPDSITESPADLSDGPSSSYGATNAGTRPGRSNSWGSNYSNSGNVSPGRSHSPGGRRFGGRMTFAFASFTPINPPEKTPSGRPISQGFSGASTPTTPPGSVSPTPPYSSHQQQAGGHARRRTYSNPSLAPIKPSLTAQQIYELALSSTTSLPPASPSAAAELAAFGSGTNSGDASPIHTSSASLHRAHSTSRPATPGLTGVPAATSPAIFRPMPDEVYLPFIDRPAEVTALLNEQPTSRLFHLLEALFPPDMRQSRSAPGEESVEEEVTDDPKKWTFERLSEHLMKTTRAQMDDKAWTDAARACIRGRSEALWERFKGALGVPAELEVEDEDGEEDDLDLVENYAESEGAVDLGGGDTESLRRNPLSGSTGDLASLGYIASEREAVIEPVFADQSGSEEEDDDVEALDDEDAEAGSEGRVGAGEGIGRHLPDSSTGALSEGGWSSGRVMENIGEGSDEEAEEDRSKAKHGQHHHHHAFHDGRADHSTPSIQTAGFEDSDFPYPQREIRALQITTSPSFTSPPNIPASAPPLGAHGSPRFRAGAAPSMGGDVEDGSDAGWPHPPPHLAAAHFPQPHLGGRVDIPLPNTAGASASPDHPVTSTPPAAATAGPDNTTPRVILRRPSESIAQTLSAASARPSGGASLTGASASATGYRGFGGYGLAENAPYHPALSERGPGSPLFPSSFADLSVGPTLLANVPKASRSATIGHGAHYPSSLSPASRKLSSGGPGSDINFSGSPSSLRRYASLTESRRAMRSTWQDVRDRYEYAVTVASASSDGGRG